MHGHSEPIGFLVFLFYLSPVYKDGETTNGVVRSDKTSQMSYGRAVASELPCIPGFRWIFFFAREFRLRHKEGRAE